MHLDLATKTLDSIDPLFANAAAKKTLQTYQLAADVPAAEKTALDHRDGGRRHHRRRDEPNKTFAKAFDSARGGLAFQG